MKKSKGELPIFVGAAKLENGAVLLNGFTGNGQSVVDKVKNVARAANAFFEHFPGGSYLYSDEYAVFQIFLLGLLLDYQRISYTNLLQNIHSIII